MLAVKRPFLIVFFVLCNCICSAQTVQRIFTFDPGEEFEKETFLSSTFVIQRGTQKLNVKSTSTVNKIYKITDVNDDAYTFEVTIPKMDVKIKALGNELHYNSEKAIDTTSKIESALNFMVGKTNTVLVNRKGIIVSDNDYSSYLANDTLLSFAGIQGESFIKGSQFVLIPNFVNKPLGVGFKWSDTSTVNRQKLKTNFWIDALTEKNTIIKFTSNAQGNSINSNTNGTYVLDNNSGVLVQRIVQSISTGYIILGQEVYAITRRINLSETCVEKKEGEAKNPTPVINLSDNIVKKSF